MPLSPLALALAVAAGSPATEAGCREASAGEPAALAWCEALAGRPRLPLPSDADQAALARVYERPELRHARADVAAFRRLLADLWQRILDRLGSTEAERYARVGRAVYLLAAAAALLAAFAALGRRRSRARAAAAIPPVEAVAPGPAPRGNVAAADEALAAGDWRGAVRHGFLSALSALEEAGRLPRARSLTNGELAARLAGGPGGDEFRALGRRFDAVVYGGAVAREPDAREAIAAAARLRAWARGAE